MSTAAHKVHGIIGAPSHPKNALSPHAAHCVKPVVLGISSAAPSAARSAARGDAPSRSACARASAARFSTLAPCAARVRGAAE